MRKLHVPRFQITQAALLLYAAEGPKGVTMRKLGAVLGIRASALYRHFEGKEAILNAVASAADARLATALKSSAKRPPRRHQLERLARRTMKFAAEHPHLFRIAARRGPHTDSEGSRAAVLRDEVGAAIRAGQLRRTDPSFHAGVIWPQFCGLADMRERGEIADDAALDGAFASAAWDLQRGLRAR
jgi:AcrR family transcriptional regulator